MTVINPIKNKYVKEYWYLLPLLIIVLITLQIRLLPLAAYDTCSKEVVCMPDLDTFYMYRISNDMLQNNLHLTDYDEMRYYPYGANPREEMVFPFYNPAVLYKIFTMFGYQGSYLRFAWIYPPIMGALIALVVFLIGKELFNNKTGLLAAFLYSVNASTLYRTSAGVIEKEPAAAFFILLTVYFFARALHKNSILCGLIAGTSLSFASISWSGSVYIRLILAATVYIILFVNKEPRSLKVAMIPTILMDMLITSFYQTSTVAINAFDVVVWWGIIALIIFKEAALKFNWVSASKIKFIVPALTMLGLLGGFVLSFFSAHVASYFIVAQALITGSRDTGVIGTTVAENNPASWSQVNSQVGIGGFNEGLTFLLRSMPVLSKPLTSLISILQSILSVSTLMVVGIALMLVMIYRQGNEKSIFNKSIAYTIGGVIAITVISYILLGSEKVLFYVFFVILSALLFSYLNKSARIHWQYYFLLLWTTFTILGSAARVRVIFLLGFPAVIVASFFLIKIGEFLFNSEYFKKFSFNQMTEYPIQSSIVVVSIFYLLLLIIASYGSAYAVGNTTNIPLDPNWQASMEYIKKNSPPDSVLMSWWDYGYWFQTAGERKSVADGGNINASTDHSLAEMFTDSNVSVIKHRIKSYGADYIIVDYTLIGKYGAMSQIANNGKYVGTFIPLRFVKAINKDNLIISVFHLGDVAFYIPFDQNNNLAGNIKISTPRGEGNVKYLCTANGYIDLNPPEPAADMCLVFSPYGIFLPQPDKKEGISNFAKLYLFGGEGTEDFLEKVYESGDVYQGRKTPEIIIYKVKEQASE